jgi:hypothetical protein
LEDFRHDLAADLEDAATDGDSGNSGDLPVGDSGGDGDGPSDGDGTDEDVTALAACSDLGKTFEEIQFKPLVDLIPCGEGGDYSPYSGAGFDLIACGPESDIGPSCVGGGDACEMNVYPDTNGIYSYGVQIRVIPTDDSCRLTRFEVDGVEVVAAAYRNGLGVPLTSNDLGERGVTTDAGTLRSFDVTEYLIPSEVGVDVMTLSTSMGEIVAFRAF